MTVFIIYLLVAIFVGLLSTVRVSPAHAVAIGLGWPMFILVIALLISLALMTFFMDAVEELLFKG